MTGTWVTLVVLLGALLLLGAVATDRNRLKRRLAASEGEAAGLRLDLAAARDEVTRSGHVVPDRWSPAPGQGANVERQRNPGQ